MSHCSTPWEQTLWLTEAMIWNVYSDTLAWRRQSHFLESLFCGGHPIQKEWSQPHKKPSSMRQRTRLNLYLILSSGTDGKTFRRPPRRSCCSHTHTDKNISITHVVISPQIPNQTKIYRRYSSAVSISLVNWLLYRQLRNALSSKCLRFQTIKIIILPFKAAT